MQRQRFSVSIGGRTTGSGGQKSTSEVQEQKPPKAEHFIKKVDNLAAIFAWKCLESRLKYRVKNSSTGTCKAHKSYNEVNAMAITWTVNALNSGAIYDFKLGGVTHEVTGSGKKKFSSALEKGLEDVVPQKLKLFLRIIAHIFALASL